MNPEIVIMTGIQGSGKSTFVKENFYNSHIRINLDMLGNRDREHAILAACLAAKQSVVIDNTNVEPEIRRKYIQLGRLFNFAIVGYYFDVDLDTALARNAQRVGRAAIPEQAIHSFHRKLIVPTMSEGYGQLYHVDKDGNIKQLLI